MKVRNEFHLRRRQGTPGTTAAALNRVTGAFVALLICAALGAGAHAQSVLVSNTGQGKGTAYPAVSTWEWAQGFTTGTNGDGYSLGSIEVGFHRGTMSPHLLTVTLREANTSNQPADTAIATLVTPNSVPTGLVAFTAPDNTILAASTTYFVVLSYSSNVGPPDAATALDSDEDAGAADGWEILDNVFRRQRGQTGGWTSDALVIQTKVLGEAVRDNQQLVSNADTELNDGESDFVSVDAKEDEFAQGFTTGTFDNTYILSSIQVRLAQRPTGTGALTVTLGEANASGQPGRTLATLTNPGTFTSSALNIFTAPDDTYLKARTTYFVVLSYSGEYTGPWVSATASGAEDAGAADGWSISDVAHRRAWNTKTTWNTDNDGLSLAISVFGRLGPCLERPPDGWYQCERTDPEATWLDSNNILVQFDHDSFSRTTHSPFQNGPDNYDCEDYYMTMRWWETFPGRRVKCEGDGTDRYAGDSYWGIPDDSSCQEFSVANRDCAEVIKADVVNRRPSSGNDLSPLNTELVKIQYPAQYRSDNGCGLDPRRNTTNSTPCSWWSKQIDVVKLRTGSQTVAEPEVTSLTAPEPEFAEQEAEPLCVPSAVLPQNLRGSWTYVTQCFENDCSADGAWRDIGYLWTFNYDDEDRDYIDRLDPAAQEYKYIEWYGGSDWGQWTWFMPEWCDGGGAGTQAEEPQTVAVQEVACEPSAILPQNSQGGWTYVTQCFESDCGPNEAWRDIGYVDTSSANPDDRDVIGQIDLTAREYKYIEQHPGGQWGAWTWFTPKTCD